MPNLTEKRHVAFLNKHIPAPTNNKTTLEAIQSNTLVGKNSTQDVNLIYNGSAWNDGTTLVIDCIGYRSIRIWGDISNSTLAIKATNATNTANQSFWDSFGTDLASGKFSLYYQDPPRYLKFENESGVTISAVNLQYGRYT